MKPQLKQLLEHTLITLQQQNVLPQDLTVSIQIERTRDKQYGDYACNIAMLLARAVGMKPRELAEKIVNVIPRADFVKEIKIAGQGFINFYLSANAFLQIVPDILQQGDHYGQLQLEAPLKVNIEFVSANPTGPLHVGHGRSAAYGATLAAIMTAAGYQVEKEYYVNDAGRQMDILATSIWLRYLQLPQFPSNGYKGDYVINIAQQLRQQVGESLMRDMALVYADVPPDATPTEGDKEAHIDGLIYNAKKLLQQEYQTVLQLGLKLILDDIRDDLHEFSVDYDRWFSETSLITKHGIEYAIEKLRKSGHLYERDNATWFNSTALGDDKDRVVVRENGQTTYFASDLAYLLSKYERGYDRLIYVLGADHHGYIVRLKAAAKALGYDADKIEILLVQFAVLYRGKDKVQMSTRSGSFVTLRQLREEVGKDAARFFYVMRKCEQHMDFDLELAKATSSDNPVYYIQYAHARLCSVLRQLQEKQLTFNLSLGLANLHLLTDEHEQVILADLIRYPELIYSAAKQYEPHLLATYLRELATDLHTYYNACQFIVADENLRNARLCLIKAVQQVLANGLQLLGLSAPEKM